jgi:hypothetical protein
MLRKDYCAGFVQEVYELEESFQHECPTCHVICPYRATRDAWEGLLMKRERARRRRVTTYIASMIAYSI